MGRPAAALPVMIWTDAPGGETPRFHKNSLPIKDAWKELGTEGMPFRMKGSSFDVVATPVSNHGVTFFFTADRRGLKVFLYKHTAPRK